MPLASARNHLSPGRWGQETEDEVTARLGDNQGRKDQILEPRPSPISSHTPPKARLWTLHLAHRSHLKWIVRVRLRTGSLDLARSRELVPGQGPRTGQAPLAFICELGAASPARLAECVRGDSSLGGCGDHQAPAL